MALAPPFISTLAAPLTIMTCSVGVCMCQGITQPAVALKTITEGPLDGSPLSTAITVHDGIPGNGANLFSENLRSTPISSAWAIDRHANITATNLIVFLRWRYRPKYIPDNGILAVRSEICILGLWQSTFAGLRRIRF